MKTLRIMTIVILLSVAGSAVAQNTKSTDAKKQTFFVQVPHTPEQCVNAMTDMKSKGDATLSKFEWGCMSGDHTAYAFIDGESEAGVRAMLPTNEQKAAKITKVNKLTAAQIEKIHKDHM